MIPVQNSMHIAIQSKGTAKQDGHTCIAEENRLQNMDDCMADIQSQG